MQRLRFTLLLIGATVLSLALGNSLLHAQGGADYILREVARLHALPPALHEQFRLAPGAWEVGDHDDYALAVDAGAYHIRVDAADKLVWGTGPDDVPADLYAEVDAFYVAGPLDNSFGLGFRRQANGDMYLFSASSDGFYRLAKVTQTGLAEIVPWKATGWPAAEAGNATRLGVFAAGPEISLLIDGEVVEMAWDDSYAAGGVALAASAPGGPGVAVAFDDLAVWPLRDEAGTVPESSTPGKPTPAVTPTPAPHAMTDPAAVAARLAAIRAEPREFADDFRRDAGRWALIETDGGVTTRTDQALRIEVSEPDTLVWSSNDGARPADFLIEADATLVEGEPAGEMGIIFRQQDSANFYLFAVNGYGAFALLQQEAGEWRDLVPWTQLETTLIVPGVTARLGVLAEGDALTLLVDGEIVAQVEDDSFGRGRLALAAGTFDSAPAVASFDNVDIWILTDIVAPSRPTAVPLPAPAADTVDLLAAVQATLPTVSDFFAVDTRLWRLVDTLAVSAQIKETLAVTVSEPTALGFIYRTGARADDFLVEVDAWLDDGETPGRYGIAFRMADGENYYLYLLDDAGHAGLWRYDDGEPIALIPFSNVPGTKTAPGRNRLGVLAQGDALTLLLDGAAIATVVDATHGSGDLALVAGTFDATPVVAHFDDFNEWRLPASAQR